MDTDKLTEMAYESIGLAGEASDCLRAEMMKPASMHSSSLSSPLHQSEFLVSKKTDTTLALEVSLTTEDDPLGLTSYVTQANMDFRAQQERVRARCVALYSSSPCWQNREAAKNPNYWKNFSPGGIR